MSNELKVGANVYERLWKLWAMICKMVMDGVRDPEKVAEILQQIVNMKVCLKQLEEIIFGDVKVVIYELIKSATFLQMLGDIGEKRQCWKDTEEVLRFSREHKDRLGSNGNFFELVDGSVAHLFLDVRGQPKLGRVYPLSYDSIWNAECRHRVFSRQQKL